MQGSGTYNEREKKLFILTTARTADLHASQVPKDNLFVLFSVYSPL